MSPEGAEQKNIKQLYYIKPLKSQKHEKNNLFEKPFNNCSNAAFLQHHSGPGGYRRYRRK